MPKEAQEVLAGLLSTSVKLDEATAASIKNADGTYTDDAVDKIVDHLKAKETARKEEQKQALSAQSAKVKRETMEAIEKDVRAEFGVTDSQATGMDLIREAVSGKVNAAATITDEKVKLHPLYLKAEKEAREAPTKIEAAVKEALEKKQQEFQALRDTEEVLKHGRGLFEGLNPVLPENKTVAQNLLRVLDEELKKVPYKITRGEDGSIKDVTPLKADGSGRLEDELGNPTPFLDLVKSIGGRYFEYAQGERKGGAPDPNKVGGGSGAGGTAKGAYNPKSTAEYAAAHEKIMNDYSDLKERRVELDALKAAGQANGVAS